MLRLVLCRHSTRSSILENDCSISVDGINLINNRMKEIKKFISQPQIIYTSPYKRTLETSYCMLPHFNSKPQIVIDYNLRETLFNESQVKYLNTPLIKLLNSISDSNINNINIEENKFETWDDINRRSKNFIDNLQEKMQVSECVGITHGGIINSVLSYVDKDYKFDIENIDPATYTPAYFDFVVIDITTSTTKVVYRNF